MAESASDPQLHVEITVPPEGAVLGGKYRVERELGRGGMGVVLAARHLVLGHRVALKILSGKASPMVLARFLREARATVELQSEHVCRVLDEGTSAEGSPFLVMEYLEGDDLLRVLQKKGPLPVEEAVDAVLQACDAMAEAHARGIVHRDLKPSNLFLCRRSDGRSLVKVLDFGVSKLAPEPGDSELTETMAMLGSPMYMSPEQVTSAKTVDHRADIWALGVVIFRLLTKRSPFEAQGAMAVCAAILRDPPQSARTFRPDLPPELEAIIVRCLEKDVTKRFPSVHELARALLPFAPEGVTSARFRAPGPMAQAREKAERTLTFSGATDNVAVELGTYGAVTANTTGANRRARRRWPWAVGGAVVLAALSLVLVLVFSKTDPKTMAATTASGSSTLFVPTMKPTHESEPATTTTATKPTEAVAVEASTSAVAPTPSIVATAGTTAHPYPSTFKPPVGKPWVAPTAKPTVTKKPWDPPSMIRSDRFFPSGFRSAFVLASLASMLCVRAASADPSAIQKSTAEALFKEGKKLMDGKDYDAACPKLAESASLQPGGGVQLALALCHEGQDKLATAYNDYREALALAKRDKRTDREEIATGKLVELEPKLSHLIVKVSDGAKAQSVSLTLDGTPFASASWGIPIPVDGGSHTLLVTAAGKKAQSFEVIVKPRGDKSEIEIPALNDAPIDTTAVTSTAETSTTVTSDPALAPGDASSTKHGAGIGPYILGGAGVVALGVGSYFGFRAISGSSDAKSQCPNNQCTSADALAKNDDAKTHARIANVSIGVGVLAISGAVLWYMLTPKDSSQTTTTDTASKGHVIGSIAPSGGSVGWVMPW